MFSAKLREIFTKSLRADYASAGTACQPFELSEIKRIERREAGGQTSAPFTVCILFCNDGVRYSPKAADVSVLYAVIDDNRVAVSDAAVEIEGLSPNLPAIDHQDSLRACLQQFSRSFRVIHHDLSLKGESSGPQKNLVGVDFSEAVSDLMANHI